MRNIRTLLTPAFLSIRLTALLIILFVLLSVAVTAYMQQEGSTPTAQSQPATRIDKKNVVRPNDGKDKVAEAMEQQANQDPQAPEVASNYIFSTATNASLTDMSTGTTTLVAADQDDTASSVFNIGFDFYFQAVRYTQFSANSNGLMRLGSTAVQGGSPYKPLAQASIPLITPYGADQRTLATTGKVHAKVIGSAPNRVLIVEWLNMQSNFNSGGTSDLTYQARLYETTGVIEYVYGKATMSTLGAADANSKDPNIGFSSSNTVGTVGSVTAAQSGTPAPTYDGSSATAVANTYTAGTIPVLNSAANGSRRIFTFTPPTPTAPTNLTFTNVTASSMTLNWTDSANETLYAIYRSTDGTNYTFINTAAQNATSFAATGLTLSTTYFWQVYAISEGAFSAALANSQATAAAGNITSTTTGGLWSATTTWVGGVVPTASDNVTIANGATVTIDTAASALSLTVGQGTSGILQYETTTARTLTVSGNVTIASGGTFQSAATGTVTTHVLSLAGNLTNNGVLDFSTNANTAGASITFTGAASNTFGGTGATTDIRAITINKGTSSTNVLELNTTNFTVRGATTDSTSAAYLTLTNGTFKVSGTFTAAFRTFTVAAYTIPATAGFWLNNPNYTVSGQAGSPTTAGLLRLTQGTYNVGTGTGNSMDGSAGAVFIIEGGTLNTTGRFSPQSAVSYTQSAGAVNVCTVGQTSNSFGCFELFSASSSFTMSGGTINLVQASTAATTPIDFDVLSSTVNYTGGTLNIGTAATATNFNFRINGNTPAIVIDNTTNNKTATIRAQTVVFGSTTVSTGTTLNLNGFLTAVLGNVTNNGTISGNTSGSRLYFAGSSAQTYSGTGTAGTNALPLQSLDVDTAGLTIAPATTNNIITSRVILFSGNVTNSNKITLGVGGSSTATVQVGNTTTPTNAGSFDVSPTFNLGTGGEVISYLRTTNARTTGNEINPTRTLASMTYDDNDATHALTIAGGDLTLSNTATALTLTNGRVITGSNNLILSSGTATVTRTNGYVDGNLRKNYTVTGTKTFEVGTANGYSPFAANVTAGTGNFTAKAVQGKQPNISGANALQRYWVLTATGLTADLTFNYLAGDVVGTEANYKIFKYNGSFTQFNPTTLNTTTHVATLTGVNSFSDWTLAEPTAVQSGSLQLSSATYNISESGPSISVDVTRTGGTDGAVGVSYTTNDGTATAGSDYTTTSGTLSWTAGDSANKTINIPITEDSLYEGNETFTVTLSAPTGGATLGSPLAATVTINDNDAQPSFSINDVTMAEGNAGMTAFTFTVTKTGSTALNATVNYATANNTATAPSDYTAIGSTLLTFLPGDTTKTVTVQVNGDTTFEPNETFFVNLSSPVNATITDNQGLGTITNDDAAPVYLVNTNDDVNDGNCDATHCSLREAINAANTTGGQINFAPSVTGNINLLTFLPAINSFNVNINGPGAGVLTVRRDNTAGSIYVFGVGFSSGTVTISGLTISNASNNHGINYSGSGTLNITNCVVSGNASAALGGGGLYTSSTGTVNITGSTFSGNTANGGEGGAIRLDGTGNLNITGSTFSGNSATNLGGIHNNNSGTVTIDSTLITGNSATFDAGGINNGANGNGTLVVTNSTITNNTAGGVGGGIKNGGTGSVTVIDSTISGNSATNGGGGIYNTNAGPVNVTRTTISNNTVTVGSGGGISNTTGTVNVTNSTFSANHANNGGGGGIRLLGAGTVNITSSTFTGNTAGTGGGVGQGPGTMSVKNTIIAGNTATSSAPDIFGTITSNGFNLIGNNSGGTIVPNTGDQIGTSGTPINPQLAPLGNYGGPTKTHALLCTSPAIDAGTNTGAPATDQRGVTRPFNTTTDIGAFEAVLTLTVPTTTLPNGTQNVAYNQALNSATGGTPPYSFVFASGSLPTGITLSSGGVLSGTPTNTGTFNFTAIVTDASGAQGCQSYTLTIGVAVFQYRSVASGNWNANATWESSPDGTTWSPAASTPTSADGAIIIRSPHTVTVTANVSADQLTVDSGGTLRVNAGIVLTIPDGTGTDITVNGTAACVGNGVISGTGSFVLSSGATLQIGDVNGINTSGATGNIQVTGTRTYTAGANYVYNGTAAQVTGNALASAPNNLTLNNTAGVTSSVTGLTVTGLLRVMQGTFTSASTYNNVQIDGGATLAATNGETINVGGNWTNDGTFTANNSTVNFNGTANQTIGGSNSTPFASLTINNTGTAPANLVTLGADTTVSTTLTLTNGVLDGRTNSKMTSVTNSATAAIVGGSASSYIDGKLQRSVVNGSTYNYPLGSANYVDPADNGYTPFGLNSVIATGAATFTANVTAASVLPGLSGPNALQRYWTLANGGITSAVLQFTYLPADVSGTEALYQIVKNTNGAPPVTFIPSTPPAGNSSSTLTPQAAFSDWSLAQPNAPTAVRSLTSEAASYKNGNLIRWQTGYEASNLGFVVYREQGGRRTRLTPSLVAGSALLAGSQTILTAGQSYTWFDQLPENPGFVQYWIEDVDLNGKRTMHGPISPGGKTSARFDGTRRSLMLSDIRPTTTVDATAPAAEQGRPALLSADVASAGAETGRRASTVRNSADDAPDPLAQQRAIAAGQSVKISVRQNGWYRIPVQQLAAAGLNPNADHSLLQLYADGVEVPMLIISDDGTTLGGIEFYGTGLNRPGSDARTYWLVNGTQPGQRITERAEGKGIRPPTIGGGGPQSYAYTVERRDRVVYVAALHNGDAENFFGPVISPTAATQALNVKSLDPNTGNIAKLEVSLQGVTAQPHQVRVALNGNDIGTLDFNNQEHPAQSFTISPAALVEGQNTVTLTALNGDADISVVDFVRVTYARKYVAGNDALAFSNTGSAAAVITGFTTSDIRVFDIGDPGNVQLVAASVRRQGPNYSVTVPGISGSRNPAGGRAGRALIALADSQALLPAAVSANGASTLTGSGNGADFVIITHGNFKNAVEPLAQLRRSQGMQVSVVDVEDIYDEFSYGAHDTQAVKDFLAWTQSNWQLAPRYVLLVGDASLDPRNYLGYGNQDYVPTRIVDTSYLETASDDSLADFDSDGLAEMAVGRLPVRTVAQAELVVGKITGYVPGVSSQGALLIADRNDGYNFEGVNQQVQSRLPPGMPVTVINRGNNSPEQVRAEILNGLNQGPQVVNYAGHGSVEVWTGAGLLSSADTANLTNGNRLPLFVTMTCLNGFFQDLSTESLAEAMLKAPNGGAVAAWASSGLTQPGAQDPMDQQLMQQLYGAAESPMLGDAIKAAKTATTDVDVRRTWILFGDPTMRLR